MPRKIPDSITCSSVDHLHREFASIQQALSLEETEETWDAIYYAICSLSALVKGTANDYPVDIVTLLKTIPRPINRSLLSDRSRLTGASTDLVSVMATSLKGRFEPLLPAMMPTLLSLATRSSKLLVKRAQACLISVAEETQLPSLFPHLRIAITDKSTSLRVVATDLTLTCLNCFNPPDLETPQRADDIETIIRSTARDASADVRKSSRKVFEAYKVLLPGRVDAFIGPMTPTMKKYLDIKAKPAAMKGQPNPSSSSRMQETIMSKSTSAAPAATLRNTQRALVHRKIMSANDAHVEQSSGISSGLVDDTTPRASHSQHVREKRKERTFDSSSQIPPREDVVAAQDRRAARRQPIVPLPATSTSRPPSRPPSRPTRPPSAASNASATDDAAADHALDMYNINFSHGVQPNGNVNNNQLAQRHQVPQTDVPARADGPFRPMRPHEANGNAKDGEGQTGSTRIKGGARRVPLPAPTVAVPDNRPGKGRYEEHHVPIKGDGRSKTPTFSRPPSRTGSAPDVHVTNRRAHVPNQHSTEPSRMTQTVNSRPGSSADTSSSRRTPPVPTADGTSQLRIAKHVGIPGFRPDQTKVKPVRDEKSIQPAPSRNNTITGRLTAPTLSQMAKMKPVIKHTNVPFKPSKRIDNSSKQVVQKHMAKDKVESKVAEDATPRAAVVDKHMPPETIILPNSPAPEAIPLPPSPEPEVPTTVSLIMHERDLSGATNSFDLPDNANETVDIPEPELLQDDLLAPCPPLSFTPAEDTIEPLHIEPTVKELPVSLTHTPLRPRSQDIFHMEAATPISMLVRSIERGFILSPIADAQSPNTTLPYPEWQEDGESSVDEMHGIEFDTDVVRADGTVITSPRKRRLGTNLKGIAQEHGRNILADVNY